MRRLFLLAVVVAAGGGRAYAGGFELTEQSAAGVGTAGAQAATVEGPATLYYNPAGMTFLPGWSGQLGVNVLSTHTDVTLGGMPQATSSYTAAAGNGYGVQRLGSHFAVGFGMFTNFALHFEYPHDYSGRFLGTFLDLTTVTFNFAVAIRPVPWLSVGFGLDIVPASFEIRQALAFGSAEGAVHAGATATGVGGNVGVMAILVPRYLTFGAAYRSTVDLDFSGKASIDGPSELGAMTGGLKDAKTQLALPHNFTFALSSRPARGLSLMADFHVTLWHDLAGITLTLTDPNAPAGTLPTKQTTVLDWTDAVGVRVGAEYKLFDERLALRIGGGYDWSPVPAHTITPTSPDAQRGLIGVGAGYRLGPLGIDVGYLAAILLSRSSTNPDYPATYNSIGHVFAVNVSLRLEHMMGRINEPAYKH